MEHGAKKKMSDFLSAPVAQTIVVAINGRKNSKFVVDWALENLPKENATYKLLYVSPKITSIPTPMEIIPIAQVPEDIAAAYMQEIEWKNNELLDIYKKSFARKKVPVDALNVEGDDIAQAIADEVDKGHVNKLVIGASSRGGMFTRKINGQNYSAKITEMIPSFCTVYSVSKGKLASVRKSSTETGGVIIDDNSDVTSSNGSFSYKSNLQKASAPSVNSSKLDLRAAPSYPQLAMQRYEALSSLNRSLSKGRTDIIATSPSRNNSVDIKDADAYLPPSPTYSDTFSISSHGSSFQKPYLHNHNHSWMSDTRSQASSDSPSENEIIMNLELESLKIELRRTRGMYAEAQTETREASRKLHEMTKSRFAEPVTPKEISYIDDKSKEWVKLETDKFEDEKREALQTKEAEPKAAHDSREKENLQETTFSPMQQYKKFRWEEIVTATSSFSENYIIGQGTSGTVFKCNLHDTTAAVKVLHSRELQSAKQFQQELEILSRIRHPYLLLLLGACPEQGCLVYEYMENGSLEDRLFQRNNKTAPIPWFDRFRIAWEIASGLVFLHNSKPKQIIHRDLKPANILLDHNLGSKIGDVGLSKMVQSVEASAMSMFNQTALVGTLSYIDPEYQRTGVNSPKSDVYAFGMILLQLLTAKTTTALTHLVETAVEDGNLMKLLDRKAGQWPLEEAKELAILGLSCAELRRRDRPDLKTVVLPTLERLRVAADRARDAAHNSLSAPPSHFLCPIIKEVMNDPCVASDGYTYDRKSIETWLGTNDKSPMTNMTLPTKDLIPNFTLLSAISQWKLEQA